MSSNKLKIELNVVLEHAINNKVMPAFQIMVSSQFKNIFKKKYGKKYIYFDLASVTKALFTVPVLIQLVQEKKISLKDPVDKYLFFLKKHPIGRIKIKDLLNQTSGLMWWRPFYKTLLKNKYSQREFVLQQLFLKEKIKKQKKCVYSDLNYILLGFILKEVCKKPLDQILQERIAKPLNLKNTFFIKHFIEKPPRDKNLFAPTEKNYRGIVRGQVHDDNCASWGGLSGHAGIFSTLEETSKMALELLKAFEGKSKTYEKNIFRKFVRRAVPKARGDWSLGFMIPSRPVSTGGKKISTASFGFPGYTGTSVWIDTKRRVVVTILSNRTYPSRKNKKYAQIRRDIHDVVWENWNA